MVVALLFTLTLLPALLVILKPAKQTLEVGWKQLAPVDRFLIEKRRWVLWAFVGGVVVSVALIPFIRFDFNPFHLRDPKGEAMSTLADLFTGPAANPQHHRRAHAQRRRRPGDGQAASQPCRR